MGCGASNNNITTTTTMPVGSTTSILLVSHSSEITIVERLKQNLLDQQLSCQILNENQPNSLAARANTIQRCDILVVLVNRLYQRTSFCMEALIYAKDMHKPIISILTDPTFRPYGALGAISASAIQSFVFNDDASLVHIVSDIVKSARGCVSKNTTVANIVDIDTAELPSGSSTCSILICTTDDGQDVAQLIFEHLTTNQMSVSIENLSKSDASSSVSNCTVFVPILTPQLEQSILCQLSFEQARLHGKPIVPVMAVKKWRPRGWLGLIIAGRVFFRIFDRETAYQSFYDTNRMTDLRVAIENACLPAPTENQREETERKALEKEIDDLKNKLSTWPPERKSRAINAVEPKQAVRIEIPEPQAQGYFEHTHHSVTRLTFHAPPAILDQYGLPKRRSLDCMISYQWDKQELVRQIYEDLHMRTLQTWFDIWSFMQGDTYNSMATGVECAKVLLVFLSKEYLASANCQLEFRYAVQRGKAFVILRTESNLQIEQWILEAIQGFPQYDVYSYEILGELINGVPLIDVITQAIRALVQAQPFDPIDDCSPELFQLRSLVDDARDALSQQTGVQRYKTCTRCGIQYDDYSKDGCKRHSEYFLGGGGLLEDQWVCCRQQKYDSPGCRPCEHIDQQRVFVEDPQYGSSSWKPP